jgi:hypothetical protein
VYEVLVRSQNEGGHSEDRGIDGRIELEWMLGRLAGGLSRFRRYISIKSHGGMILTGETPDSFIRAL